MGRKIGLIENKPKKEEIKKVETFKKEKKVETKKIK